MTNGKYYILLIGCLCISSIAFALPPISATNSQNKKTLSTPLEARAKIDQLTENKLNNLGARLDDYAQASIEQSNAHHDSRLIRQIDKQLKEQNNVLLYPKPRQ